VRTSRPRMNAGASNAAPKVSVVIPTRDRPEKLRATLAALFRQAEFDQANYEVIVVDDGSFPPVDLKSAGGGAVKLDRLEGGGRSAARNRGAELSVGELLIFVDDDMQVGETFLAAHWRAHVQWPGVLQLGAVRLPSVALVTPFGRFRQALEDQSVPDGAGPIPSLTYWTAQNMAIEREAFARLGGFNPELSVSEDQDLAERHAGRGGELVFVPDAAAVHDDDALTLDSYCDRAERYMAELVRFGALHPGLPDTVERARVNGPTRWGREPAGLTAKKLLKTALTWPVVGSGTHALVRALERYRPESRTLDRLYRAILGAHLQHGYRRGLRSADER
jgi:GT2 family glycosyltransferase